MGTIGENATVNGEPIDPAVLTGATESVASTAPEPDDDTDVAPDDRQMGPNGFPLETSINDMTIEEQAAYHKYHKRKAESRMKQLQQQLDAAEAVSADKIEQAQSEAREAGLAEGLQVAAGMELQRRGGWTDEQFERLRPGLNLSAFVSNGKVDAELVDAFFDTRAGAPVNAMRAFNAAGGDIPKGGSAGNVADAKQAEKDRLMGRKETN